jgi:anthranilate phosphoribosyltransferase
MRHAVGPRREMGIRTVFNVLGPLTNPAGARRQLLGAPAPEWVPLMAAALAQLGTDRALVVHGLDGLDEISTLGPTLVHEVEGSEVREAELTPEQFGLARATPEDLAGTEPPEAAAQIVALLEGEPGPRRDIMLLNAAAAIYVGGRAESIADALPIATESLDSGAARRKLRALVRFSHE